MTSKYYFKINKSVDGYKGYVCKLCLPEGRIRTASKNIMKLHLLDFHNRRIL